MNNIRRWLQFAGLLLGGAILLWQIRSGLLTLQQGEIRFVLTSRLILALPVVLGAVVAQMYAWSSAMKSLGVSLPARDVYQGYLLSFLPRYIPGTIWGYISRSEWLYQNYSVNYAVSNQGSIVETLSAIVANAIIIALFHIFQIFPRAPYLAAPLMLVPYVSGRVLLLLSRVRLPRRPRLNALLCLLFPPVRLRHWQASVGLFLVVWLLYGAALHLIFNAVQVSTAPVSAAALIHFSYIYAAAWLVGFFILFVPAGLGFREFALTNLLSSGFSVSSGAGSMIAILFRLMILIAELVGLGTGLLMKKAQRSGPKV